MRTFTIEQVRGWLGYRAQYDTMKDVGCDGIGLAAWCDRQAKAAPALPPRPSDATIAAGHNGKPIELTGECRKPKTGDLYFTDKGRAVMCLFDDEPGSAFGQRRWIVRTIEPAAPAPAPEATPQAKTCATCDFHRFGQCRKNSPNSAAATLWPKVSPTDGCGKWKAAAR